MSARRRRRNRRSGSRSKSRSTRGRYSSTDFNPDYSHVIQDLRRIGLLAGSFLVVLILLSYFLN